MYPYKEVEEDECLDNEEMADLMIGVLESAEFEFGYDFEAAVSVEDGDYEEQCEVHIVLNRQKR